jgi:hypothetical protein
MDDALFIGTSAPVTVESILRLACCKLKGIEISAFSTHLSALSVENGREIPHDGGLLSTDSFLRIAVNGNATPVSLCQFESEIVEGYSIIMDPITVSVGAWIGAAREFKILAACLAYAVATNVRSKILDSEHIWSDQDLSDPEEFMNAVKLRFSR